MGLWSFCTLETRNLREEEKKIGSHNIHSNCFYHDFLLLLDGENLEWEKIQEGSQELCVKEESQKKYSSHELTQITQTTHVIQSDSKAVTSFSERP